MIESEWGSFFLGFGIGFGVGAGWTWAMMHVGGYRLSTPPEEPPSNEHGDDESDSESK